MESPTGRLARFLGSAEECQRDVLQQLEGSLERLPRFGVEPELLLHPLRGACSVLRDLRTATRRAIGGEHDRRRLAESSDDRGLVLAPGAAQLTRELISLRHEVVGRDRQKRLGLFRKTAHERRIVAARACAGEGHGFSAHSSGNVFSMRFVFALYLCIVALGLFCGIAVSVV